MARNKGINPLTAGAVGAVGGAIAATAAAMTLSSKNTRERIKKAGTATFHQLRKGAQMLGEEVSERGMGLKKRGRKHLAKRK